MLVSLGPDSDNVIVKPSDSCEAKPSTGKSVLKARFGRKRTHNEQLLLRPCGIFIARATFHGSEAISAVKVAIIDHFSYATLPDI